MNNFLTTYFVPLNLHPLFYITVAYILGIWIALPMKYGLIALCAALIALMFVVYRKHYDNRLLLFATILIFAVSLGSVRLDHLRSRYDAFHALTDDGKFDVYGQVTAIESTDHPIFDQCISLETEKITQSSDGTAVPLTNKTMLHFYTKPTPNLKVGDHISIDALTFRANKSSFAEYLIKEGIAASFFINYIDFALHKRPEKSLMRWLFYKRQEIHESIRHSMNSRTFLMFSLIFLGKRTACKQMTERIKQHFNTWGVTHYLARAGLHMIIFALIWHMILNLLPLHYLIKQIILMILAMIYCLLSWHTIPFWRAFIQFLLYKTCILSFASSHSIHILTVTCLAVLLHNPMHLFFLDFQLSFGITLTFAWFNHMHNQKYKRA